MKIHFSDFFDVPASVVAAYGAFNISLINDIPVFIDPFLIFNSKKKAYKRLHDEIIDYVRFLRDESASEAPSPGLLKNWYYFPEVKENWLGYSKQGNSGSGLGKSFATSLHQNLGSLFSDFGKERITRGSHLEKLCLVKDGVGRDNISDFTTNLIKGFLCEYTQKFAELHLDKRHIREFAVTHASFNRGTKSWETRRYRLPSHNRKFVLLTPRDILTKDEAWINKTDMIGDFDDIAATISNQQIRDQINHYLMSQLPKDPKKREIDSAVAKTFLKFPDLIDFYIRHKEDNGSAAVALSNEKMKASEDAFINNVAKLSEELRKIGFYEERGDTLAESHRRVEYLKKVIENNDGYRIFYIRGKPVQRESDLQLMFKLTWYAAVEDVNAEVNNGRGPVDFKISRGSSDSTLVEFKLASNSKLKQNLENQVAIYEAANQTRKSIKVILHFNEEELLKVNKVMKELGLAGDKNIVLIDASRDNKVSASKAKQKK